MKIICSQKGDAIKYVRYRNVIHDRAPKIAEAMAPIMYSKTDTFKICKIHKDGGTSIIDHQRTLVDIMDSEYLFRGT